MKLLARTAFLIVVSVTAATLVKLWNPFLYGVFCNPNYAFTADTNVLLCASRPLIWIGVLLLLSNLLAGVLMHVGARVLRAPVSTIGLTAAFLIAGLVVIALGLF